MKTIRDFQRMKIEKEKISMLTCYDYWSACIIDNSDIDAVLVGDSASMVMHGYESTVFADLNMMCYHIKAVSRGIKNKFIIGDMPFLTNRKEPGFLIDAVDRFMKAGAHAVKIEGADGNLEIIDFLVKSGVPVMGHLGLTPQSVNQLGGYRVQGRDEASSKKILDDALKLQGAGCFSLVLEMVPSALAKVITETILIPTIGIGGGAGTDGQILVLHDMLGMNKNFNPKFVRKYMNGYDDILQALNHYNKDVKEGDFPGKGESH